MASLDIVPSYIKIFDKYDNCKRFLQNSVGKSKDELNGYYAVAIICYEKAIERHEDIGSYLNPEIKKFFGILKARFPNQAKVL